MPIDACNSVMHACMRACIHACMHVCVYVIMLCFCHGMLWYDISWYGIVHDTNSLSWRLTILANNAQCLVMYWYVANVYCLLVVVSFSTGTCAMASYTLYLHYVVACAAAYRSCMILFVVVCVLASYTSWLYVVVAYSSAVRYCRYVFALIGAAICLYGNLY